MLCLSAFSEPQPIACSRRGDDAQRVRRPFWLSPALQPIAFCFSAASSLSVMVLLAGRPCCV